MVYEDLLGLRPLDPASDVAAYKVALVAGYDDQIRLLRSVPYWYLLPLYLWQFRMAAYIWRKSPAAAIVVLLAVLALYVGIGWLNVVAAHRALLVETQR